MVAARLSRYRSALLLPRRTGPPFGRIADERAMSSKMAEQLRDKERVEEDRFVREIEKKFFDTKRAERERLMLEQEREKYRPIMMEAEAIVAKSGDALSEDGLEAVARWKVDGS